MKSIENQQWSKLCTNPKHYGKIIEKICLNLTCPQNRLLCIKCLQEDKHKTHIFDLKNYSDSIKNMGEISNSRDYFIDQLQGLLNHTLGLIQKLNLTRQQYQVSEEKMAQMSIEQISQFFAEMLKFHQIKEQVTAIFIPELNNINQMLENYLQDHFLTQVFYPEISDNNMQQAKELYKQGILNIQENYEEAIKLLNQSLDLNPKDPSTLWCKGCCLQMMAKYEDAILWFDKALKLDPKNAVSLSSKGENLRMMNKYQEALICIDKLLVLDPQHIGSLYSKGDCLRMMDKYSEALTWLDKTLEINSKHVAALGSKGACLRHLGKYQEAIIWYDKALSINPTYQFSLNGRELCHLKLVKQKQ